MTETADCSGGTATCTAKAVCKDCGAEYGEKDLDHHTGGTATCTQKAICQRCKQEYGDLDPNRHSVIPATCIAPATCKDCGKELEPINPNRHYGGEATCITKAICELCGNEYGEIDPDNHDYEVTEVTYPTCVEPGSASYICKNCNDSGTETIPATGHRFFYSDLKEVSTAEGSGIELECDLCHVKKTVPLYAVECKAGETYTDDKTVNALINFVSWSSNYTFDYVDDNRIIVKNSAGKLLFTATQTQGEGDTYVWTFLVGEGVTSEDSDTAVVWGDGAEPEYGVKCSFIAIAYTITYDLDGGAAEGNPASYNAGTGTFTLNNPTRPGYTFTGWSGTGLTGENNLTVTIKKGSTGDRAYKAHWRCTGSDDDSGYSYCTIKATAGAGGSISPSGNVSVREGTDQTFTITPDQGYAVSNVKIDGKSIGAVKSYTFENVKKSHTIEVSFAEVHAFADVPAGSYYEDAVNWATENGITQGTDAAHFSPDGICTRAQAVTFLWRAAGSPEPETGTMPFTDVPVGSYYYDAVLWAVENGITKGTSDTTFSPNATCTRAQIVTFLWRSEKFPAAGSSNPFTDVAADAYYADAVLWAVKENITRGTTNTTFSPDTNCTRAQIVTFLWRAYAA